GQIRLADKHLVEQLVAVAVVGMKLGVGDDERQTGQTAQTASHRLVAVAGVEQKRPPAADQQKAVDVDERVGKHVGVWFDFARAHDILRLYFAAKQRRLSIADIKMPPRKAAKIRSVYRR